MRYPELQMLFNQSVSTSLAAGVTNQLTQVRPEVNEVWEIEYLEIDPPVEADGTIQDLRYVYPVVDGASMRQYVVHCGRQDALTNPATIRSIANMSGRRVVKYGDPIWSQAVRNNPLRNTTLKVMTSFNITEIAGDAVNGGFNGVVPVNENRNYRAWGYKYTEAEFATFVGMAALSVPAYVDKETGVVVPCAKQIPLSLAAWNKLPGGARQDKPYVNPYMRFARNAKATSASQPYTFDSTLSNVQVPDEDLQSDGTENQARIITSLAVRSTSDNLKYLGLIINGDDHPYNPNFFQLSRLNNMFQFGQVQPMWPDAVGPLYFVPRDYPNPKLIWQESGGPIIQDNGTPIPAFDAIVLVSGFAVDF